MFPAFFFFFKLSYAKILLNFLKNETAKTVIVFSGGINLISVD